MEEVDRLRVAAVLAADAELEVRAASARPSSTAILTSRPTPSASRVSNGRDPEDAHLEVAAEERALDVVAGEAPGRLGQVVGAEGEELGRLGDLRRRSARPAAARSSCRSGCGTLDAGLARRPRRATCSASSRDGLQLLHGADQRDHDLRRAGSPPALTRSAAASAIARTCMREQAGDDQAETDAAQAEHRVLLVQPCAPPRAACGPRRSPASPRPARP